MPDTFFTASPHWTWYIIPYFFIGGIAGGAYFLAALLEWFGRPEDRPVIRTGYSLGFWGAVLSGALLTLDLGRSLRFWHMLFQSNNLPHLMFKSFSPISFGAWALLLFGACAFVSWYSNKPGTLSAKLIAAVGGLFGFILAGYTGVLLSVTNRPIWADSPWLGALFLASGASTGAAALVLFAPGRGATQGSLRWLESFDVRTLVVELLLVIVFVVSLGTVAKAWLSVWGFLLVVGVVGAGILWPLWLHLKPAGAGGAGGGASQSRGHGPARRVPPALRRAAGVQFHRIPARGCAMKVRWWIPLCAACVAACAASPEASRSRGGGPGADPGNHGAVLQIHAGAKMYYKTPCRTPKVKCSGPLPGPGD